MKPDTANTSPAPPYVLKETHLAKGLSRAALPLRPRAPASPHRALSTETWRRVLLSSPGANPRRSFPLRARGLPPPAAASS